MQTKLYIYEAYIYPNLLYTSPAWSANLSQNSWSKLKAIQLKILWIITDQSWFISNLTIQKSAEIISIQDSIKTTSTIF